VRRRPAVGDRHFAAHGCAKRIAARQLRAVEVQADVDRESARRREANGSASGDGAAAGAAAELGDLEGGAREAALERKLVMRVP
jgi:hypothetical protein